MKKVLAFLSLSLAFNAHAGNKAAEEIKVERITAQKSIVIKYRVKPDEVGQKLTEGLAKISKYLGKNIAGAPYSRYFNYSKTIVDFEVGFPVNGDVAEQGEIVRSTLPAGDVATTATQLGPQDNTGAVYEALHAWIAQNNYEEAGAPWEVYLSNAESDKNLTKVYYPIKAKKSK